MTRKAWSCVPRRVVVRFLIVVDEQEGEMIAWAKRLPLLLILLALPMTAQAQSPVSPPAQSAAPPSQSDQQLLKPEELDALVAPIALYPDTLLSQILMASTYPLEVVQAERWIDTNKKLKGDQLKAAVDKQSWDDSVKSLVATPSVLTMMNDKLDWTQKLGDAVLAQQPDVMDAIQRLRTKAQANKKLESNEQQNVTVKQQDNKQVIVIEQKDPNTVYVPYYNPSVVYGSWPPSYPPYYFPPPGYIAGGLLATGLAFGAGYAMGSWMSGGNTWNSSVNWNNNNININNPGNRPGGGNNWQHRPEHRQGVRYGNNDVRQKFGNNDLRGGANNRMDFRGRGGEQVLRPGGDRGNIGGGNLGGGNVGGGNRPSGPGAGNRPGGGAGAGARPGGGRPSAGTRPSGGGRDSALGNISSGRVASRESGRGRASLGGGGGGGPRGGGGGLRAGGGGGGGGLRGGGGGGRGGGGGGGGRGGGGGGRRSDIRLKHDIALLGRLDNGLGIYRFSYNGSNKVYVGVLAQEVMQARPDAAVLGRDGYLRVYYQKLGIRFETYQEWLKSGGQIEPARSRMP
jgi:Protein of unknown function (DUF3300)